jgi:tRNA(Arg) A34 adenosine deaminase TadA
MIAIDQIVQKFGGTASQNWKDSGSVLPQKAQSYFQQCDLYVTVEPCVMCASALRQLGTSFPVGTRIHVIGLYDWCRI